MNRPSFRRRLAMWSSVLAGGTLLGFALLSSWLINQAKVERLDVQIEAALLRMGRLSRGRIPLDLGTVLARELGTGDDGDIAIRLVDADGFILFQSEHWPQALQPAVIPGLGTASPELEQPELPGLPLRRRAAVVSFSTQRSPMGRWRVGTILVPRGQGSIAVSLTTIRQEMATIRRIYLVTIPGALLLVAGGAWGLSGRALKPIQHLSKRINQVTARGLDQRVSTRDVDQEFEGLIQSFNAMLERLERSFHQATRFSGDAAHELKTPLAILQGELEQAIQQAETGSTMQQTLTHLLEEVGRLGGIVRKLLLLSLADAGQMALRQVPVDLGLLLAEQLEDVALLAPDLTVTQEIEPNLKVACDRDLITQVIQNLISNAIKYNRPQGWMRLRVHRQPRGMVLTIANSAHPLSPDEREHLFDRFYRGDAAHSRQTDGLGLGLSLCREIVRAHGGELSLDDSPAGEVQLRVWIPDAL